MNEGNILSEQNMIHFKNLFNLSSRHYIRNVEDLSWEYKKLDEINNNNIIFNPLYDRSYLRKRTNVPESFESVYTRLIRGMSNCIYGATNPIQVISHDRKVSLTELSTLYDNEYDLFDNSFLFKQQNKFDIVDERNKNGWDY